MSITLGGDALAAQSIRGGQYVQMGLMQYSTVTIYKNDSRTFSESLYKDYIHVWALGPPYVSGIPDSYTPKNASSICDTTHFRDPYYYACHTGTPVFGRPVYKQERWGLATQYLYYNERSSRWLVSTTLPITHEATDGGLIWPTTSQCPDAAAPDTWMYYPPQRSCSYTYGTCRTQLGLESASGFRSGGVEVSCPSPPPSPPPSPAPPPDLSLEPSHIYAGEPTSIAVGGSAAGYGDTLVFLHAGTADCAGAAQKQYTQGARVSEALSLTVTLSTPAVYKLCQSSHSSPTLDTQFLFVSSAHLVVHAAQNPSPPSPPPPPPPPPSPSSP